MHMLRVDSRSIDGAAQPIDLDQTPADIVALSFTDTDLAVLSAAWTGGDDTLPSLRLANLANLKHPFSVDLYLDKVISKSRFVLVRLLGGKDYWRYGVDELAALARRQRFHLAVVPGDHREDAQLIEASTLPPEALRQIWSYFAEGGPENIAACLRFVAGHISAQPPAPLPVKAAAFGIFLTKSFASPLEGEVGPKVRVGGDGPALSVPARRRRHTPLPPTQSVVDLPLKGGGEAKKGAQG